jgi:hypothetical protein
MDGFTDLATEESSLRWAEKCRGLMRDSFARVQKAVTASDTKLAPDEVTRAGAVFRQTFHFRGGFRFGMTLLPSGEPLFSADERELKESSTILDFINAHELCHAMIQSNPHSDFMKEKSAILDTVKQNPDDPAARQEMVRILQEEENYCDDFALRATPETDLEEFENYLRYNALTLEDEHGAVGRIAVLQAKQLLLS